MKKKHLLMLLLFISCAIHAMAQTDYYYYYKGNKFPLILNENKVVVSIPKEYEETIERIRANVQVLKTIGDDYFDCIVIMRSDFEKLTSMDSWAEDSKYVLLDSCYFTENYFEGYATPYMTVKIKKEQDIDILTSYSERYRLRIVKQDSFMPLWYILSITLETGKTALEIANMLWESGDFASSEPDIAFDSSDPILSLSVNIDGLNYYLDPKSNVAIIIEGNNVSGELDIPSEVSYNEETFIVKSVFFSAFDNNQELTKVRIPKTMESVAHQLFNETDGGDFSDYMNPFMSCTALESVEVDEENPSFKSVDGVFFSKDGTELYCYPSGKQQKVYSIPEGVEWIGSRSFEHNYYLTTLTIPSTMKRICDEAIGACIKLTDVYCYAENVPNTGDYEFVSTPISSATLHVPANSIDKYKATYPWSEFGNIVALSPDLTQIRIKDRPSEVLEYIGKIGSDFDTALDSLRILKSISSEIKIEPLEVIFDYDNRLFFGIVYGDCGMYSDVLDTKGNYYLRTWYSPAEDPVTYIKDQMATIILPTEPDASKGKYYRLDRCEDNQIIFEQELQPRARVPYIIVPVEDFSIDPGALNLEGLHSDTVSIEGVSFIGSYVREELPALTGEDGVESSYIDFIDTTPDCGPSISAETGKESLLIGTLRAYLIVKWDDPIDHGSPSVPPFGKKEIVLKDFKTEINSLTPDPSPRRGEVFDLQGRRIDNSKLPRGIYIKDKKKVLIK